MKPEEIKEAVRSSYSRIALQNLPCCPGKSCCGGSADAGEIGASIGYNREDMESVPDGSNLGLGCGNPVAPASLREGETVLDLGSGAGFDAFLSAQKVGKSGRVIGIDMTPEMVEKARANAQKGRFENVEFKLGEIENLPIPDGAVDAVISNCVINLVPDKERAFREAYRVLKPGGRLMVSDIVLLQNLPEAVQKSVEAYAACIAGALRKEDYLSAIMKAGFEEVTVVGEDLYRPGSGEVAGIPDGEEEWLSWIVSIKISAIRPYSGAV